MPPRARIFILLLCFLCTSNFTFAQSTGNINGNILDDTGEAALYANVILKSAQDSSMVKGAIATETGEFSMVSIPYGNYFLAVSYIGFDTYTSEVFELNAPELNIPTVKLQAMSNELEEVTITAQRPLLEMKPDKMVFNVEGTINNSGNNALELLRKSPGVIVDNNESLSLLGKSGVRVYINDKESPLSGDDLAAFLKTLQADQIDAIEIITNPSARYDAEGNAGIINIKLKKDSRLGSNVNLNLGYSIGYEPRYNGSVGANYRNQKMNVFGSYGHNNGENINYIRFHREQYGIAYDNTNDRNNLWQSHDFKFGTDYYINDKNTVGFMVNGYTSDSEGGSLSRTEMSTMGKVGIDSVLVSETRDTSSRQNINFNINYQFNGEKDVKWNIDADYGLFRNDYEEYQPNFYKDPNEAFTLTERIYSSIAPTDIDIWTFKVDHERPAFKGKLETGVKFAYVQTDNNFSFFNHINNVPVLNIDQSNDFVYTENVNAAYVNYSTQIKKWGIQAGLRGEQTNSKGELIAMKETENDTVTRHYFDLFPSVGVSYQLNQKHNFNLSYSRRINRPSYQDLNPFVSRLDEQTFEQGNPFLNPEYTNSFQLRHSFNYMLNTTVSFSHTNNVISRLLGAAADSIGTYITWANLTDQYNYSINVAAPVPIAKWWNSYNSITAYHLSNQADLGNGNVVDISTNSFHLYSQHTFTLPWQLSLEVSGWYSAPAIWEGNFKTNHIGGLDFGVQKKLFNDRGKLRLAVSDILKTNDWGGTTELGPLYMSMNGGWDSRRFSINFSYLFGNEKIKGSNRKSGLEDENKRIKSDG